MNVEQPISFEDIIRTLETLEIKTEIVDKDKYGFSRTIKFKVYDIIYKIEWYKNESKLLIGEGKRPAQIPFKFIYFDRNYPLVDNNKSIGFSYSKTEKRSVFDREYPYEVFRIPLEIKGQATA